MRQHKNFAGPDAGYREKEDSKIIILPVPYDGTSTWVKGADKGPLSIIEASSELEMYDIDTDFEVSGHGIYTNEALKAAGSPEAMVRDVEKKVSELLDEGKFVVTLGGEHSVSIGAVRANNSRSNDLSVLQLDAHTDMREEYNGSPYNHACVMARVKEICPAVHVGIRSMCSEEKDALDTENVFFAKDIAGKIEWIDKAVGKLSDNVYVTIDLDVFDPSIMPSTGTPQPGGLYWDEVISLLKAVSEKKNVVGFDVVELCPIEGLRAPDFLAAKLVYKFLSMIHKNGRANGSV